MIDWIKQIQYIFKNVLFVEIRRTHTLRYLTEWYKNIQISLLGWSNYHFFQKFLIFWLFFESLYCLWREINVLVDSYRLHYLPNWYKNCQRRLLDGILYLFFFLILDFIVFCCCNLILFMRKKRFFTNKTHLQHTLSNRLVQKFVFQEFWILLLFFEILCFSWKNRFFSD